MRLVLISSLLVATVSSLHLVHAQSSWTRYIVSGNVYAEVDYEKAHLFKRVWWGRSTYHEINSRWEPSSENIQNLVHDANVNLPENNIVEFVIWKKNEDRYFVFDAPRFYEVDRAKFTTLRSATTNFLEHQVDDGLLTVHCERTIGKSAKDWQHILDTAALCVMCFCTGALVGLLAMSSADRETRSAKNKTKDQKAT